MKFLPSLNIDVFMLQMFLDPIWLYIKAINKIWWRNKQQTIKPVKLIIEGYLG